MAGAIVIGVLAGVAVWVLAPADTFASMSGRASGSLSIGFGLVGALLGFAVATVITGIGDDPFFDLTGISGAILGTLIVVPVATAVLRKRNSADRTPVGRS